MYVCVCLYAGTHLLMKSPACLFISAHNLRLLAFVEWKFSVHLKAWPTITATKKNNNTTSVRLWQYVTMAVAGNGNETSFTPSLILPSPLPLPPPFPYISFPHDALGISGWNSSPKRSGCAKMCHPQSLFISQWFCIFTVVVAAILSDGGRV